MPARPWAVFVCRKIPSPTWLNGSLIANAAERESSVRFDCVAVAIRVDCVDTVVAMVDVEFNTSGDDSD